MSPRGTLHEAVAFDPPLNQPDVFGGIESGWDTANACVCSASFRYRQGSETVLAARLEGRQPVIVTVMRTAASEAITTGWRMRDVRRGVVYNIRAILPTDDRLWLEILCEGGVAV